MWSAVGELRCLGCVGQVTGEQQSRCGAGCGRGTRHIHVWTLDCARPDSVRPNREGQMQGRALSRGHRVMGNISVRVGAGYATGTYTPWGEQLSSVFMPDVAPDFKTMYAHRCLIFVCWMNKWMVPPKLGLGQMALEDNIGVLQEAQMGRDLPLEARWLSHWDWRGIICDNLKNAFIHSFIHAFNLISSITHLVIPWNMKY